MEFEGHELEASALVEYVKKRDPTGRRGERTDRVVVEDGDAEVRGHFEDVRLEMKQIELHRPIR